MCAPPYTMGGYFRHLYRLILPVLIAILLFQCASFSSSSKSEAEMLLKFKSSLGHRVRLSSWNTRTPPCVQGKANWIGILCAGGNVWGLNLENMGLFGDIDVDALQQLANLRTISLMNNKFNGSFPKLNKMVELKSVYLSGNNFSGQIDSAFDGMHALKKIHIENNRLSGPIPSSFAKLEKLVELHLDGNMFSGEIPDFKLGIMKDFNVANNQLNGPIPPSLSKLEPSSFSGNQNLCGAPLQKACPSSGVSTKTIIAIVAGIIILILLIIIIITCCKRSRKSHTDNGSSVYIDMDDMEKASAKSSVSTRNGEKSTKLTFLRDDTERFELGDLLKASAEVLGSGYFGASYRAALTTGKMMVVKRFKYMNNVDREEFQEHMRRLGRLSHPNLLSLVAFYYRKEEKLLVADYVDNVNLAVHLHGNRSRVHPSLDWPTRLNIIKGVAKGLQYLYTELPSLMLPHGHLKSSNVLLTPSLKPVLTDYALSPVVNHEHAQDVMVAYKSPEYKHHGRVTKKTDVWSFGILILETLTGKFPSNILEHEKGGETDLVSWVESVLNERDLSASDLFDKEMGEVAKESVEQMMKLLKIGLACADNDEEKRLDLKEAACRIEEVKEKGGDDEFVVIQQ